MRMSHNKKRIAPEQSKLIPRTYNNLNSTPTSKIQSVDVTRNSNIDTDLREKLDETAEHGTEHGGILLVERKADSQMTALQNHNTGKNSVMSLKPVSTELQYDIAGAIDVDVEMMKPGNYLGTEGPYAS
jgi:flagellar biosynthesis component FlhA